MASFEPDTGTDHAFQLHLPAADPPPGGFPLLWLLDAPTTWGPMQQALDAAGRADSVMVIGIGWQGTGPVDQGLRRRDFTLPARGGVPAPRGGGDWGHDGDCGRFLDLLAGTLQPLAAEQLPIDPSAQLLAGHSLSGLFVLDTLLRRPDLFCGWAAASPSLWWDGKRIFAEVDRHADGRLRDRRVLLTVGSEEQRVGPEKPPGAGGGEASARLGEPHMVDYASTFAERLSGIGADCRFELIEGEGHGSVLPAAMTAIAAMVPGK